MAIVLADARGSAIRTMGDAEIAFTPADSRAAAVTCTWRTTDNVFLALMTD